MGPGNNNLRRGARLLGSCLPKKYEAWSEALNAFSADQRGLDAMRVLLSVQTAYNLGTFWIFEMVEPNGLLSEEMMPRSEFECESIYCATANPSLKVALGLIHLLALLHLARVQSTVVAIFVYVMQCSLHNRNMAGTHGADMLLDRSFLAIALLSSNSTRPHNDTNHMRKCDGGVILMFASFTTCWCLHGIEKLIEWEHWWSRGDALLLSLYSDEAYLPTRAFADWMLRTFPMSINAFLCRVVVLLEFPMGTLLMIAPSEKVRLFGFSLVFLLLISFSMFLNVEFFPWTCIYMALPFVPTVVWDAVHRYYLRVCNVDHAAMRISRKVCETTVGISHQNSGLSILTSFVFALKNLAGCAAALLVVFHAVRSCLDHHPSMTLWGERQYVVSPDWDPYLRHLGDKWHFYGGWKAFTPPPTRRHWYTVVGVPLFTIEQGGWNNSGGRGIAISFYGGLNETALYEGAPYDDVHWSPPFESMAHMPFWRAQARQAFLDYTTIAEGHLGDIIRKRLIERVCQDFHERHTLKQQQIGKIAVWNVHMPYKIKLKQDAESGFVMGSFSLGEATPSHDRPIVQGQCH